MEQCPSFSSELEPFPTTVELSTGGKRFLTVMRNQERSLRIFAVPISERTRADWAARVCGGLFLVEIALHEGFEFEDGLSRVGTFGEEQKLTAGAGSEHH